MRRTKRNPPTAGGKPQQRKAEAVGNCDTILTTGAGRSKRNPPKTLNKAVFIDRDDTICRDVGYCRRPEDLVLLPGSSAGLKLLNESGFKVVVITNQSGIARGFLDEAILDNIHAKMKEDLSREGASVDAIYYCPHHPDEGCSCRKPAPELGLRAIKEQGVDPRRSFVIGDRLMDILFARALGCKAILISNPKGIGELQAARVTADFVAADLEEAANWVLHQAEN